MPVIELSETDESKVEEFAGALFGACLATVELANVELGIRLGLYEALAGAGPVTAAELADRAGIAKRTLRLNRREALVGSSCRTRMRTSCSMTTVKRA